MNNTESDNQNFDNEIVYPPAPWQMSGQMWTGLFKTHRAIALPDELKPLLGRHRLLVTLVRYTSGTLQYNELVFGVLVYLKKHIGIFVDRIWVDDEQSLWGGRKIWGVAKEFAHFSWHNNTVTIIDDNGHIVTLTVNPEDAKSPPVKFAAPGFGRLENHWTFCLASFQARIGWAGLRIDDFTDRNIYLPVKKPTISFAAKPFHMTLPAPKLLGDDKPTVQTMSRHHHGQR